MLMDDLEPEKETSLDSLRTEHCLADDTTVRQWRTVSPEEDGADGQTKDFDTDWGFMSPRDIDLLPAVEEEPGSSFQKNSGHKESDDSTPVDQDKIKKINQEAANFALRGNEKMALRTYKTAVKIITQEVARIHRRMEHARNEPEYLRQSVRKLLNEEWTVIALTIAETKTMMSIIYERLGDYTRAIKCCNEASDVYDRQMRRNALNQFDDLPNVSEDAERLAAMAMKLEEAKESFPLRKELHEIALQIHREIAMTDDENTRDMLYENLYDKISAALALERENLGHKHPQVAESLAYLSGIHFERGDLEKAISAMKSSIAIAETSLGCFHPRTAEKYYELGRQYDSASPDKRDKEYAFQFYEKAVQAYKEADGNYSKVIGSLCNDIGVLRIQQGQYEEAIQRLSDALSVYATNEENRNMICADTAQVWRNIAECYVLQGQWGMAAMNFDSALNVQEDARKLYETVKSKDPGVEMPVLIQDESIADTLRRLGKAHTTKKEYRQANDALIKALSIFQAECEKVKERGKVETSFDQAKKQDQVASIMFCLAELREAEEKFDEALKLYDESLELRVYSDRLRPKGESLNLVHCAMCLSGVGKVRMAKKQYGLAFKTFNEAIQCTRQAFLPENHPISKMLWEKSKEAAEAMGNSENLPPKKLEKGADVAEGGCIPTRSDEIKIASPRNNGKEPGEASGWFQTAARLEKKAQQKKQRGDIHGAIETMGHVLEFRRAYLKKRTESQKTTDKAKQQVAKTIVALARLLLIKEKKEDAKSHLQEALKLYISSGLPKGNDRIQEVQRDLDRIKWQIKHT